MQATYERQDESLIPARNVEAFVVRTRGITTSDLRRIIPPDCLQPSLPRALAGVAASVAVAIAVYAALIVNPYWWLLPPLWFIAGTTLWGLYVIGHDCGHGSFSRSQRLNH